MSTLFVAAIVVGFVVAICLLLISIHDKHKRVAMKNILNHFSRLGTESGLNFSGMEILTHSVLGIDSVNRKIMVVSKEDKGYDSFIIDLNEVKNCTVKTVYGTIKSGDLKDHKLDQYLEKIVLHFELHGKPPMEIEFYKNVDNHIYETRQLEQKAKHWEAILSKMQTSVRNSA